MRIAVVSRPVRGPVEPSPLVTIGIPTFNRSQLLVRALQSVLSQDYPRFEVVVSDNASSDETRAVCLEACQRDKRVRYIRREENSGPTANFNEVLRHATGSLFMWLSDDDTIGPGYVSACVRTLTASPETTLVVGRTLYKLEGEVVQTPPPVSITATRPVDRVLAYYASVDRNETFYGLMRTEDARAVPLLETMGGDWHFCAGIAFIGGIATVHEVTLERSLGGATRSFSSIAKALRQPWLAGQFPYFSIAVGAWSFIHEHAGVYRTLAARERLKLATQVALLVMRRAAMRFLTHTGVTILVPVWTAMKAGLMRTRRGRRYLQSREAKRKAGSAPASSR